MISYSYWLIGVLTFGPLGMATPCVREDGSGLDIRNNPLVLSLSLTDVLPLISRAWSLSAALVLFVHLNYYSLLTSPSKSV